MALTQNQLAAILKVGEHMAKVMRMEKYDVAGITEHFDYLGVPDKDMPQIKELSKKMDIPTMFSLLSTIGEEYHKRICVLFSILFTFDGSDEYTGGQQLLNFICEICSFKPMLLSDANKIWDSQLDDEDPTDLSK